MTDRDGLMLAILENPADDIARTVYADCLDELGGAKNRARAELIRVQCALSRTPTNHWERGTVIGLNAEQQLVPYTPDGNITATGIALDPGPPNPAYTALLDRANAILKKYALAFLPKSLREPYPRTAVEGAAVYPAVLGGYVTFRRGFPETVGREFSLSPAYLGPETKRFAEHLRALFQHNPLTGFSVSFDTPDGPTLHGEFTQDPRTDRDGLPVTFWRVGWDMDTYCNLPHDAVSPPLTCATRDELARCLVSWFVTAIRRPAEIAAAQQEELLEEEEEPPDVVALVQDPGLGEFNRYMDELQKQIYAGMGIPRSFFLGDHTT